ncbi:MAG: hypothetical protein LC792_26960 [Actinobacteria bacterium]|nr:hypothetical protein [Actinomycetota bacterium]
MSLSPTAAHAIEAYGGESAWRNATTVEATATITGLLFRVKRRRVPRRARVVCRVHQPLTRIEPIDSEGHAGVLEGPDVRIETAGGEVVETRPDARSHFTTDFLARWDSVHLTYFVGYICWNFLVFPALLLREDVDWTETGDHALEATFPPGIPSHPLQRHVFNGETGLLERTDYVPEVTGDPKFVPNVANRVLARGSSNGIPYEAHRRVKVAPNRGRPLPLPAMVELRFSDLRIS